MAVPDSRAPEPHRHPAATMCWPPFLVSSGTGSQRLLIELAACPCSEAEVAEAASRAADDDERRTALSPGCVVLVLSGSDVFAAYDACDAVLHGSTLRRAGGPRASTAAPALPALPLQAAHASGPPGEASAACAACALHTHAQAATRNPAPARAWAHLADAPHTHPSTHPPGWIFHPAATRARCSLCSSLRPSPPSAPRLAPPPA
jgi:hypothetical protein